LAAAVAVLGDDEYLARSRAVNASGMTQVAEGVARLGLSSIPSVGNFVAVEMPGDAAPVYQRLLQQGVIVRPLQPYQMPRHLRVSIGLSDENAKFLAALSKVL
jgi:histidinol-phosphate aminotransferase